MTDDTDTNTSSPSTRWGWGRVKISPAPQATGSASAASTARRLSQLDPREPLKLTVRYRGGDQAWWEIRARGRVWRRPGVLALHDVLDEIVSGRGGKVDGGPRDGSSRSS